MATMAMRTEPGKGPTSTTISRETKNGRTLTYSLTVIQQPERARACGSGAKSSADRRPVDPPPVVELRVFDDDKDITFSYGANFFLFATLEVARPIAHGRVQPTSAPQVPVLTGMPVSGMAYLDRPKEAGYFIFPDLSVRHEGIYTLSFNLYEETREGQEDGETEGKGSAANHGDTSFDWRMEVKSRMFTVFSAKKFPGLAESTLLSRTVAEQGCRVRIRRDVRMRRRDGKGAAPEVEVQQEEAYRPGARQLEQEYRERSRSNSGSPDGRPNQEGYRSQSGDPIAAHAPAPAGGYLNFNQQPQFHAPMPAQNSYPPQQHSGPPQHHAAPYQPTGHWNDRQYPQSANPYHHPQEEEFRRSEEGRRASSWQPPTQHPIQPPFSQNPHYPVVDTGYNSRASFSHARPYSPVQRQLPPLPPPQASLKMPRIDFAESKYEHSPSPAGPLASFGRNAHPLPSPSHYAHDRYNHFSAPPLAPAPVEPIRSGNKRSHDQVFHSSSSTQPLHNGMRPDSVPAGQAAFDEDDENEDDAAAELLATQNAMRMQYKRADGGFHARVLPLGD